MESRGDEYFEDMAYVKALKEYQRALEKKPNDKGIKLKIAQCYDALNNPEEVSYFSSQSVSDQDATADDVYNYAESLASTENYEKADRIYSRYASMSSGDSRVEMKKDGIDNIENYYNDSLAYRVSAASFNTEQTEFGVSILSDEVYFVSNRGKSKFFQRIDMRDESKFLDVYRLNGDDPELIDGLGKNLHEGPMTDLGDGKILITENYPEPKKNSEREKTTKLRMLIYEDGDEGWEVTGEFPFNSTAHSVGHPSFDKSTNTLYYASNSEEGKGGVDLYKVSYTDGQWGSPVNLSNLNTEGDEMFPHVNGNDLYFSSNGRGGLGGLDNYTTKTTGGPVYTMGFPVNTPKDDFGIVLREDGRTGYFSSNRDEGMGMDDIYEVVIYKLRVDARAIDGESKDLVGGNWKIVDSATGDEVSYAKNNDKAVFDALRGRNYTITTDDEYYEGSEGDFTVDTKDEMMSADVPLTKTKKPVQIPGGEGSEYIVVHNLAKPQAYKLGVHKLESINEEDLKDTDKRVVIEDVFFKFNSDEIVKGVNEIDKVIAILKGYEDVEVEITAYCDARGSDRYNKKLAEKRAQRVEKYMTDGGIEADRIRAINIGEAELYNDCKKCNEEQHQQNRRVEFSLSIVE